MINEEIVRKDSIQKQEIYQMIRANDSITPAYEKYTLTIREASNYFNIGNKKMRRLAEENLGRFAVVSGNRFLIIRPKFEQFLAQSTSI